MKSLPKLFATNKTTVEKYNLNKNFETFSEIKPTKRGSARESFSDVKNSFMRAALDKIFGSADSLTESWRVGLTFFDGRCYICNEKIYTENETGRIAPNAVIHADHIVPHSKGGTASAGNILAAHSACNNLKAGASVDDFLSDRPEQLAKVKDFQKFYNYSAPDPEVFQRKYQQIVEICENAIAQIDEIMNT